MYMSFCFLRRNWYRPKYDQVSRHGHWVEY